VTARLVFEIDKTNDAGTVKGPGARELLVEIGARRPFYSHLRERWMTSAKVAINLLALAQHRGIEIEVIDRDLT
jgi:hypothetical protein